MKFLDVLGGAVTNAFDFVIEKNRVQAQVNRIRLVMRNESQLMDKAYRELGKYYYHELRDTDNAENKKLCETIDKSKARMLRAQECYHKLMESELESCTGQKDDTSLADSAEEGDITLCCAYDDENDKSGAEPDTEENANQADTEE